MIKLVTPMSFRFNEPSVSLVKVASRGLHGNDLNAFLKRASHEFADAANDVRPGEKLAHMLAIGAYENYGCFAAGTPFARGDGSYSPIEDVAISDDALTADGNVQEVSAVFHRDVPGGVAVSVCGLHDTLRCSADHPFRVARFEQFGCWHDRYKRCLPPLQGVQNICNRPKRAARDCVVEDFRTITRDWAQAATLRAGDFLVWTAPTGLDVPWHISAAEGYMLGAWLAEGSFQRNPSNHAVSSFVFSIHINEDEFLEKLRHSAARVGLKIADYAYPDNNCRQVAMTGSPELARRYETYFNAGALRKRVPPWVCCLPREIRCAILAGYIDGDGSCMVDDKENRTTARSHSRDLAMGMQRLAWSLGMPAVVCNVAPKPDGNQGYNLSIANSYLDDLAGYSWKVKGRELKQTSKIHGFCHEGRMYLPVRAVETIDEPFEVFNVEVAGDHTYSGPNVDSHNCNRNGDAFPEKECVDHHDTFRKYGRYHRGHKNKPTDVAYGRVIKTAYNRDMHRIELLVGLYENAEAARAGAGDLGRIADSEIEKLASGKDVPVSMGCKVAFDQCNFCGNHAREKEEYCDTSTHYYQGRRVDPCSGFGAMHGLSKIADDGRIQHVINPRPTFFDISGVGRGADPIAFGLGGDFAKAASAPLLGGAALASAIGLEMPYPEDAPLSKHAAALLSAVDKLAAAERATTATPLDAGLVVDKIAEFPQASVPQVFRALADANVMLSVGDWLTLLRGKEAASAAADEVAQALPRVFNKLASDPGLNAILNDAAGSVCSAHAHVAPERISHWAQKLATTRSVDRNAVVARAQVGAIRNAESRPELVKKASMLSPAADALAREYAIYQARFLVESQRQENGRCGVDPTLLVRRNALT